VLMLWHRRRRRSVGLTWRDGRRQIMFGLLAYLASLPLVYGVYELSAWAVKQMGIESVRHPLQRALTQPDVGVGVVLLSAVMAVLAAPLSEELVFRGILQNWLSARIPGGLAVALVAVAFGVVHPTPTQAPLVVLGLMLGYLLHRTGSLVGPLVLHTCFNAGSVILLIVARFIPLDVGIVQMGVGW